MPNISDSPASPRTVTREELYELVWSQPMRHLATTFGLSDQGLAKICKRFAIPRPPRGHWNKVAVGKKVVVTALPPAPAGAGHTIIISPSPAEPAGKPEVQEQLDTARRSVPALRIPERLVQPHPVIASWIAERERVLKKRQDIYDSRLRRSVSPSAFSAQERRRHRILNALFKALEANRIKVIENDRRDLQALHGKEKIEFQLRVKLRQVKRPLTADELRWRSSSDKGYRLELEETDTLLFEVKTWLPGGLQRNWQDGRKSTVEDAAGDIVATLVAAFPLMEQESERKAELERLRQIEERRRYELEQQRKLDRDRFRRLLEHAGQWRDVQLARTFLSALEEATPDPSVEVGGRPMSEWIAWATERANSNDPLSDPASVFESIAAVTNWTYR